MGVQDRKTVACDELDAYFEKNPHPDGKIMASLAQKLGLNKKQVSNFFERSRRKANIVVESRRKGAGNKQQSTTPAPETFPATPAAPATSASAATSRKRSRRGGNKAASADDEDEVDSEEEDVADDEDAEGESEVEQKATRRTQAKPKAGINSFEDEDEDQEDPSTKKVLSSSPESAKPGPATYRIAASRYQTRRAGPVEHVPLPPTNSINPAFTGAVQVRASSPLALSAATLATQNSSTVAGEKQEKEEKEKKSSRRKKRKTSSTPSIPAESPTVQFLKNPFPTPISSPEDGFSPYSNSVYGGSDAQSEGVRRQARVWFQKTESNFALQAITGNGRIPTGPASFRPYARITSPIPAVEKIRHTVSTLPSSQQNLQEPIVEEEYESEMESAYDEEESAAIRRDQNKNRPGAALRSTIACSELKSSFLANPHPAAAVLDALANRLGLGKKQVSNYFVRERKKAGYQIKVRHGLNAKRRRAGGNKQKSTHAPEEQPSVVITQHREQDTLMQGIEEEEEEDVEEQESDFDDDVSEMDLVQPSTNAGTISNNVTHQHEDKSFGSTASHGVDDLPDLAYDDVASLRSENMSSISESAAMMRNINHSQQSSVTTEEVTSPPFGVTPLLLPSLGLGNAKGQVYHHGAIPRIA